MFLCNNLLAAYSCCGDMRHAHLMFDGMPSQYVVSWNTLIAGYSSQGSWLIMEHCSGKRFRGTCCCHAKPFKYGTKHLRENI